MTSLFAGLEREANLIQLGDALQVMEQHVDFTTLAAKIKLATSRLSGKSRGRSPFATALMRYKRN